ncbi:MAG: ABC transporter ATP-binding protein [Acidimicrobiales bacterium]
MPKLHRGGTPGADLPPGKEAVAEQPAAATGGHVRLVSLTKRFDDVVAVDGIDMDIAGGEFFSMLGPSGCGKTTTLRMIGGFEQPTAGRILLDGSDVALTPPYKRNINTVFQSYALFPHLSVFNNVAFGLKRHGVPRDEVRRRVAEALEMVQLTKLEKRKPAQMSGGQQQRVALARALVLHPSVLLLDEPLGALDAKLRSALQLELKALQRQVGITFIYVTHDQQEAVTMSDRIAVMNGGRVEQVAAPQEVYEAPSTMFVADFLGVSNVMDARACGTEGSACVVELGDFKLTAEQGAVRASGPSKLVIRPERVRLEPSGTVGANRVPAMVERWVYLGNAVQIVVRLVNGVALQALIQNTGDEIAFTQGSPVTVHLPPQSLRVLAGEAGSGSVPSVERSAAGEELAVR